MTVEIVAGQGGNATFPPTTASVPVARKWIRKELDRYGADFIDTAEMLGCEIVTNAIRHGSGEVAVSYTARDGRIRFEVYDEGSDTEPTTKTRPADSLDEGGWGLQLLNLYGAPWGTERTPHATRLVWYELRLS